MNVSPQEILSNTLVMNLTQELATAMAKQEELSAEYKELLLLASKKDDIIEGELDQAASILRACLDDTGRKNLDTLVASDKASILPIIVTLRARYIKDFFPIDEVRTLVDGIIRRKTN